MPRPISPVLVDFEARSRCDLRKTSGRRYWEHPSTEALCAVLYDTATGEVTAWEPGDAPPVLELAVAHNAHGFDKFAAQACGWQVMGWLDSSQAARRAGLPGALDALAAMWLGRRKDLEGSKLTKSLSRPSRAKKTLGQLPAYSSDVRARVIQYCAADVEVMADAWPRLQPWTEVDADACAVDALINDRGIMLDREMVRALQAQIERGQDIAVRDAAARLSATPEEVRAMAMSPAQLVAATGLPNAQKATLDDASYPGHAHPLVAARRALASIVPGKLEAALNRVSDDGRLRDSHHYYGAHTGRWSSKGMQHHNLPRTTFEDEAKLCGVEMDHYWQACVDHALAGGDLTKKEIDVMLRACLVAAPGKSLCILDYSGIEARANVWAAGDTAAVDVFRALDAGTGPDPYRVLAATIFGIPVDDVTKGQRGVGKIGELMLGYGAGPDKFRQTCEAAGTDLEAFGTSAGAVVDTYRKVKHPAIVRLWKACERAFASACEGKAMAAGPWRYEPIGSDVACVLPSGRPIVYPGARARRDARGWGWEMWYTGGRGKTHVYGGLLVENAIQALCRDFLADALVRCERAGLDPVLHVHDEAVCEVDSRIAREGLEEMRRIMSDVPAWADGLPIRLDGFITERYRK